MKHKGFVAFCLSAMVASIYLFATAPVPLEATNARAEATIPVERVLDTVNDINAKARQIYTKDIVGAGKAVGLGFDEDWRDDTVEAGPLPALFLRATAAMLERDPVELGLFLGSDHAINPSNAFAGEQLNQFDLLKADGRPRFGRGDGEGAVFGMYADIASAQACVTCHNEHRDTPKTDWRLGDIMGATTWTYPRETVSVQEYVGIVDALYSAIGEAYKAYLAKVETFQKKPEVGERWPRDGFFLPDADTFMAALRDATAARVIVAIAEDARGTERTPEGTANEAEGSAAPRQRRRTPRPRSSDARRRGREGVSWSPNNVPGSSVTVQLQHTFSPITLPFAPDSFTFSSTASMTIVR